MPIDAEGKRVTAWQKVCWLSPVLWSRNEVVLPADANRHCLLIRIVITEIRSARAVWFLIGLPIKSDRRTNRFILRRLCRSRLGSAGGFGSLSR